jgi:S-DNA-T family DNA segregation ATPase FtsK/SpoIIIE
VRDLHGLMKELLSQIRQGTLDGCRDDVSRHQARSQKRPEPWSELRAMVKDSAPSPASEALPKRSAGSFLLEAAASRLLDSLALAGQQRDQAMLRQGLKKRLDECHLACKLLGISAGNAGKPWNDVDLAFREREEGDSLDVRIGTLTISSDDLRQAAPDLGWDFAVPAMLPFEQQKAVCISAPAAMREKAVAALESVALRLLMGMAPGRMRLAILDPAEAGIGMVRWLPGSHVVASSARQMETILEEIAQHIQAACSTKDPNSRAGEGGGTLEPSWMIIGLDCAQLTPKAVQKLHAVIRNGRECSVYALLHWVDRGSQHERERLLELLPGCTMIAWDAAKMAFTWQEDGLDDCLLHLDALPSDDVVRGVIQPVAAAWQEREAKTAQERVAKRNASVSFAALLERGDLRDEANWWTGDSTIDFEGLLGLAIDGDEIGEPVVCRFGRGAEHALLAGVTASGKNNLLNVLITTLAIRYSPEELEFFMIDLKEGVEFQHFARCGVPHARVISVSNDPEFALNVLRGLEAEMENRGRLFTASGATNIAEYRKKSGKCLSRILLIVDEAKSLYGGNDSSYALSFFDKMAAKGRSFGLHLLLANQGFSGASLRLSTIANMGIRLVTKGIGERTAENVLESNNAVLGVLSQYEAVYNNGQGSKEHNHPCRVPQWTDSDDEYLQRLARKAPSGFRKPIVFDGHDRPLLSSCSALDGKASPRAEDAAPRMWLGAPMSLQEFVCVEWQRESKQNLLIVDADEEEATGLIGATLVSLLDTVAPQVQQFSLLDHGTPRKAWSNALTSISTAAGQRVVYMQRDALLERLNSLAGMIDSRTSSRVYDAPSAFLILNGVHRLPELHNASPSSGLRSGAGGQKTVGELLGSILRDGPYVGVHVIAWCDTAENVRRLLEPGKLRGEFGMVAAGRQPEDTLSRSLVGSGKAASVGANRMVFANSGDSLEPCVFRPYGLPEIQWLEAVVRRHSVPL